MAEPQLDKKTFDLLSAITGVLVIAYVGSAIFGLAENKITWETFYGVIGTPTLTMLGFWIRGKVQ